MALSNARPSSTGRLREMKKEVRVHSERAGGGGGGNGAERLFVKYTYAVQSRMVFSQSFH